MQDVRIARVPAHQMITQLINARSFSFQSQTLRSWLSFNPRTLQNIKTVALVSCKLPYKFLNHHKIIVYELQSPSTSHKTNANLKIPPINRDFNIIDGTFYRAKKYQGISVNSFLIIQTTIGASELGGEAFKFYNFTSPILFVWTLLQLQCQSWNAKRQLCAKL